MTQNEKDLLLQDICSRLPYGVVVGTTDNDGTIPNFWSLDMYNRLTEDVRLINCEVNADRLTYFCDTRPYLLPLDKISGDMWSEYLATCVGGNASFPTLKSFDWCNEHHVDYRGLIPMGLANDATNKNIY